MADDVLDPNDGAGTAVAPGDGAAADPNLTDDQQTADPNAGDAGDAAPNPVEALAADLGWSPKDKFRGNPDDWKPADEFIRAGRDIQRNVSRELKEVRSLAENMSRTSAAIVEQQIASKRAELESKFKDAVDAGDTQAAFDTSQQINRLSLNAPTVAPPQPPEVQDFTRRHASWFNQNEEATAYAVNRSNHYAAQGLSPARQLAAVEQDMKKHFPDLFPAPAKAPPQVRQPPGRTATTSARAKSFHDLPAEAQKVAKDMVERGVIPSTDLYVANFFAQNERKVG